MSIWWYAASYDMGEYPEGEYWLYADALSPTSPFTLPPDFHTRGYQGFIERSIIPAINRQTPSGIVVNLPGPRLPSLQGGAPIYQFDSHLIGYEREPQVYNSWSAITAFLRLRKQWGLPLWANLATIMTPDLEAFRQTNPVGYTNRIRQVCEYVRRCGFDGILIPDAKNPSLGAEHFGIRIFLEDKEQGAAFGSSVWPPANRRQFLDVPVLVTSAQWEEDNPSINGSSTGAASILLGQKLVVFNDAPTVEEVEDVFAVNPTVVIALSSTDWISVIRPSIPFQPPTSTLENPDFELGSMQLGDQTMSLPRLCTKDDVENILSEYGVELFLEDLQSKTMTSILDEASQWVYAYLITKYDPADLAGSAFIRQRTARVAAYLLAQRRGNDIPNPLVAMYEDFQELLMALLSGSPPGMSIPGIFPREQGAPAVLNFVVEPERYGFPIRIDPSASTNSFAGQRNTSTVRGFY